MQTKTKLFIISGLIVLIIGLAAGAYFLLKTPDDVKEWHNAAGQLHRENDQPALIRYGADGIIFIEAWYLNGQLHRENDQPAEIQYYKNGEIEYEAWFLNGRLIKEQPPKPGRP